jgi:CHAD domain-containing protein
MKKGLVVQPKKSFRQNARSIVPALLDVFLSQGEEVMTHPRRKMKLHAMRIDGKRVRYGMEIFAEIFGSRYAQCLEEVKTLLDVMGMIHDCDVHIPKLQHRIQEIRLSNTRLPKRAERVRVTGLTGFTRELQRRRTTQFDELVKTLRRWDREHFTDTVIRSMKESSV